LSAFLYLGHLAMFPNTNVNCQLFRLIHSILFRNHIFLDFDNLNIEQRDWI